jgi:integrase
MAVVVHKQEADNVITLSVVNGKLVKKPEVKYNKDGSVDKRHSNRVSGVSSEVYPFSTQEDIKSMVNVFNERIKSATNDSQRQIACRNKMLFLIGINLSLRISDLITLRWNFFLKDDMNFRNFYKIQPKKTQKTGKFVTLYFNDVVRKAIIEYIEQYPIEDMNDFIFKSRKGSGAVTERGAWKIIVDVAEKAGIEYNVGTHSLRKTFGYHIWHDAKDKEKALVMLMAIFNHSSIATTKKYIGIMNEEIESVFNDLNLGIDLF